MVTTFFPPYNFGGDGIFVERLAHALADDGNEVHVIHDRDAYHFLGGPPIASQATSSQPSQRPGNNLTVHTMGGDTPDTIDLIARHQLGRPVKHSNALKRLLDQDFDVIHFHNVSLMGGPGVLNLGRAVKLCTLHDHWFVCAMHALWRFDKEACTTRTCMSCTIAGKRPPQWWRYTGGIERAAKSVDAFIAPSEFAKESHLRNGFPAPIRVLPHFVPNQYLASASGDSVPNGASAETLSQAASQTFAPHGKPYFIFAGRLEKLKGVQFLIEQFRTYRNADLLIAGAGDYENELRNSATGLEHIHFLGRVTPAHLKSLYQGAIAALVPSLCYETFGLVALEAFAQGTPAVVNNLGALPEVVKNGGGLTYNNAEELIASMERLRTDTPFRAALGQSATDNLLSNYTQQRHLDEYYGMIAQLNRSRSMQEVR